ncbi:hypothetical protein NG798_13890 [Ancylothrix sp. C2]|nr:hypothetical protein [Ancylothrix sp. D3o]
MNQSEQPTDIGNVLRVNWPDRWQIYQRLRELQIPCSCTTNQPLRVEINNATHAIQLQSVLKQFNYSRQELQQWLNLCWQLSL